MFHRCPKCGHHPLPKDQALPAACPACGVVLAKVRAAPSGQAHRVSQSSADEDGWLALIQQTPARIDTTGWWARLALWAAFALWGLWLIGQDHRTGAIGESFLHRPLLIFHEAGHVLFMPFGHWLMVAGGTLGQLLMPLIMLVALLRQRGDAFEASFGLWFLGVSVLDVAPYVYDALHPQLTLLNGATGEAGGHDWIYLLSSMRLLDHAPALGGLTRAVGAAVVLLAVAWAAWLLARMRSEQH